MVFVIVMHMYELTFWRSCEAGAKMGGIGHSGWEFMYYIQSNKQTPRRNMHVYSIYIFIAYTLYMIEVEWYIKKSMSPSAYI